MPEFMTALGYIGVVWCLLAVITAVISSVRNARRCHECADHLEICAELEQETAVERDPVQLARLVDGLDRAEGWYLLHLLDKHPKAAAHWWTDASGDHAHKAVGRDV